MNYNKICLLIAFFLSLNSTNLVYVSNADPAYPVQVIDVDTRTLVGNVTGTYVESMGIAANSAGTKLYLVNRTNQSLDVIDVYQNAVVSQIPLGDASIYQVAITPDNSKAFVTSNGIGNFYEIDLNTEVVRSYYDERLKDAKIKGFEDKNSINLFSEEYDQLIWNTKANKLIGNKSLKVNKNSPICLKKYACFFCNNRVILAGSNGNYKLVIDKEILDIANKPQAIVVLEK